ncbi:flagellar basal body L-ring protein FlgH [Lysobacter capsici]|uniref:flagellar basal body L-ring protein FlgH n=1 Tax=Lysobacter capsici TaxID=435897 RepID=UPI000AD31E4A|nr:flagellar basal body L-ring protein FlgH [Lysobacter capsici]
MNKHAPTRHAPAPRLAPIVLAVAAVCAGPAIAQQSMPQQIEPMPMPAPAPSRESLIDVNGYRGLAADHRAHRIGDVITVYVIEATRAKSQAATDASSDLDMRAGLTSPSTDFDARLGLGGSNRAGAQTTRVGELRTQISAQVVAVTPDGSLQIQGLQTLKVNGEKQTIKVSGLVRPEDVGPDNTVLSHRIANADLELVGVGVVSSSQRQSLIYRMFKWLRLM